MIGAWKIRRQFGVVGPPKCSLNLSPLLAFTTRIFSCFSAATFLPKSHAMRALLAALWIDATLTILPVVPALHRVYVVVLPRTPTLVTLRGPSATNVLEETIRLLRMKRGLPVVLFLWNDEPLWTWTLGPSLRLFSPAMIRLGVDLRRVMDTLVTGPLRRCPILITSIVFDPEWTLRLPTPRPLRITVSLTTPVLVPRMTAILPRFAHVTEQGRTLRNEVLTTTLPSLGRPREKQLPILADALPPTLFCMNMSVFGSGLLDLLIIPLVTTCRDRVRNRTTDIR